MKKQRSFTLVLLFITLVCLSSNLSLGSSNLPEGNGVQTINPHVHEVPITFPPPPYSRGKYYHPFLPDHEIYGSGQIKAGTWLTIGFGWGADNIPLDEIDATIDWLIETGFTFLVEEDIRLFFDGEEIECETCWKVDDIFLLPMEQTSRPLIIPGTFMVYLPFRYYIPPGSIGIHSVDIYQSGEVLSGWIEWVPVPEL